MKNLKKLCKHHLWMAPSSLSSLLNGTAAELCMTKGSDVSWPEVETCHGGWVKQFKHSALVVGVAQKTGFHQA